MLRRLCLSEEPGEVVCSGGRVDGGVVGEGAGLAGLLGLRAVSA
jgi:hypothetical protein